MISLLRIKIFPFEPNINTYFRGLYIGKYPPPGGGISADVIWGKKYEKAKKKRGKCKRKMKKGERTRKKAERK
jgi:hypothetical protein